jgi:hypothetical protein
MKSVRWCGRKSTEVPLVTNFRIAQRQGIGRQAERLLVSQKRLLRHVSPRRGVLNDVLIYSSSFVEPTGTSIILS